MMKYMTRVHLSQILRDMRRSGGDVMVPDDFVGDMFIVEAVSFGDELVTCELHTGQNVTMHPAMYRRLPVMEDNGNER